jgi:hypothetical protein
MAVEDAWAARGGQLVSGDLDQTGRGAGHDD